MVVFGVDVPQLVGISSAIIGSVIVEHAVLSVTPAQEDEFEACFAKAKTIIASMDGFRSLTLLRCIERRNAYLLIVEWNRLEDHTEGFRGSAQYQEWRRMLHHFYDPFPTVEHYIKVQEA